MNAPDKTVEFKSLVAAVKAVEGDNPNGEFEAILSTEAVDREGETIVPGAFEPLPKSIPIFYQHDWRDGASPVGRGEPFYDGKTLKVKGTFASTPRAQEMRTLVNEGMVDAMSVGFLNAKRASVGGQKAVTKADLFESSFTAIPVNSTSAVLTSKALEGKAGARNSTADQKRIQTMHDTSVELGAGCGGSKSLSTPVGVKSIVGSVEALQDRVRDALEDAYAGEYGYWGYLRGVIPNDSGDGGTVVFDSSRISDGYDTATFQQTYTDDGAVVTLTGTASEVDVHEIVVPDADADREPTTLSIVPKAADDAAAPGAAASPAAETDDPDDVAIRAALLSIDAHAALA